MKYFNHLCCAGEDDKIEALRDEFGLAGYGAYFLILEKIGAQIRKESGSTSLTLSIRKWAKYLDMKPGWTLKTISTCGDLGLFSVGINGELVTINAPNILKYADEYSKKIGILSRQAPDPSPERVPNPGSKAVRKEGRKRSSSRVGTSEGPDAPLQPPADQTPEERKAVLQTLRAAQDSIGKEPKAEKPRISAPSIRSFETPPELQAEELDKEKALLSLGLTSESIEPILNAWVGKMTGEYDDYALAAALDLVGVKGLDRTKVYEVLGVV